MSTIHSKCTEWTFLFCLNVAAGFEYCNIINKAVFCLYEYSMNHHIRRFNNMHICTVEAVTRKYTHIVLFDE